MPHVTSTARITTEPNHTRRLVLCLLALAVAALGLAWAKWVPYTDRIGGIAGSGTYPGKSMLASTAGAAFERASTFTLAYTEAVWKALIVALLISACVDVLVPRSWLLRVLGRRTVLGGSLAGGLAALPGMMCTCCTAPLTVTVCKAGVPTSATLAFWLGNPALNPAVLVFIALLTPWPWVAVRIVLGLLQVIGVSTLIGHLVSRREARTAAAPLAATGWVMPVTLAPTAPEPTLAELPGRFLCSLGRLMIVLVPEYLIVVFLVGMFGEPLSRVLGDGGAAAVLIAAVVGTLLGLAAAGASAGVLGALLLVLPAYSLPSAVMVGRALGWRVTAGTGALTAGIGVLAGGLLTVLL